MHTYAKVDGITLEANKYDLRGEYQNGAALIYIHGGGWNAGDKGNQKDFLKSLSEEGYLVVSINHRFADEAIFPAQIHDVNAAIKWVKSNASKWRFDIERIALIGNSSGGHLAVLAALSTGDEELKGNVGNQTNYNTNVKSVVNVFGPSDLLSMAKEVDCANCIIDYANSSASNITALLGCRMDLCPEKAKQASPISYIDSTVDRQTSFLHIHGEKDNVVPVKQSERLQQLLTDSDVPSQLIIDNQLKHQEIILDKYYNQILDFLDSNL